MRGIFCGYFFEIFAEFCVQFKARFTEFCVKFKEFVGFAEFQSEIARFAEFLNKFTINLIILPNLRLEIQQNLLKFHSKFIKIRLCQIKGFCDES